MKEEVKSLIKMHIIAVFIQFNPFPGWVITLSIETSDLFLWIDVLHLKEVVMGFNFRFILNFSETCFLSPVPLSNFFKFTQQLFSCLICGYIFFC